MTSVPDLPSVRPNDDAQAKRENWEVVKEGLAEILVPRNAAKLLDPNNPKSDEVPQSVFYNPIQQFNRDLSVLAIFAYGEDLMFLRKQKREKQQHQRHRKNMKKHPAKAGRDAKAAEDKDSHGEPNSKRQKLNDLESPSEIRQTSAGELPGLDEAVASGVNGVTGSKHDPDRVTPKSESDTPGQDAQPFTENQEPRKNPVAEDQADNQSKQSKPKFTILDALSATGLRALRYATEIPFSTSITANDLSKEATVSISANVKHNGLEDKIKVVTGNALAHLYSRAPHHNYHGPCVQESRYDVIDLDPYGTAVPFLDPSLSALSDGGLLCVTCTDAGVFNSVGYPEKTYAMYGGTPIKGHHSHEGGLRLILHAIATAAARHGMAMEPLMSLSIDFYARVFVRISKSPADVKFLASKTMLVYSCDSGCGAWTTQFLARYQSQKAKDGSTMHKHGLAQAPSASLHCAHCGFKTHLSGPMWGGPLHNPSFLARILGYMPTLDKDTYATKDRIEGMLSTAFEETLLVSNPNPDALTDNTRPVPPLNHSAVDRHPFFFKPSSLAGVLHCQAPSDAALKGAIRHAGYSALRSHAKPASIRTDAPWSFIWEMMREWVRQKAPIREGALRSGLAGWGIMNGKEAPRQANGQDKDHGAGGKAAGAEGDEDGGVRVPSAQSNNEIPKKQEINFDEARGKEVSSKKRLIRYQVNPRENWGPMNRAKG